MKVKRKKNREKIEAVFCKWRFEPTRKRMRSAKNDVEVALLRWMNEAQCEKVMITKAILQKKSKYFSDDINVPEFVFFPVGFRNLKRNTILYMMRHSKYPLRKIALNLRELLPCDIFNADETALFW